MVLFIESMSNLQLFKKTFLSNRFPGDHSKKSNNFIKSLISELKFSLIICDGPPGGTKGGRSGLVPVMRSKLERSTLISSSLSH